MCRCSCSLFFTGGSWAMHETRYRHWVYFKFRENVIDDRCTWNLCELSFLFWVSEQVWHDAKGSSGYLSRWPCFPMQGSDAVNALLETLLTALSGAAGLSRLSQLLKVVTWRLREMTTPKNVHRSVINTTWHQRNRCVFSIQSTFQSYDENIAKPAQHHRL